MPSHYDTGLAWLERHAAAVRHTDDSVSYHDDSTASWWRAPVDDVSALGRALEAVGPEWSAGEAYSRWCAETDHTPAAPTRGRREAVFNPTWIKGKTIARVEMHYFPDGRGRRAADPIIVFTDGSTIAFGTTETDVGRYGTAIAYTRAAAPGDRYRYRPGVAARAALSRLIREVRPRRAVCTSVERVGFDTLVKRGLVRELRSPAGGRSYAPAYDGPSGREAWFEWAQRHTGALAPDDKE